MLRKNQSDFKFLRPMSNMRRVLLSVEQGNKSKREILEDTGLDEGRVKSALFNLAFIGAIQRSKDREGRSIYVCPGEWCGEVAANLRGVNSIFNVR